MQAHRHLPSKLLVTVIIVKSYAYIRNADFIVIKPSIDLLKIYTRFGDIK